MSSESSGSQMMTPSTSCSSTTSPADDLLEADRLISLVISTRSPVLNLSHRNLTLLPPSMGQFHHQLGTNGDQSSNSSVTCLHLNDNALILPPSELLSLTSLVHLTLDHNRLTLLPDGIAALVNLEVLNIGANPLASLPDQLDQLGQLRQLWCNDANLSSFPTVVFRLCRLEKLSLAGNAISRLPTTAGCWRGLSRLRWLSLAANQLAELPDEMAELAKSLILFNLNSNALVRIPACLAHLTVLRTLLLRDNRITGLSDDMLLALAEVSKIDLRDNAIGQRPPHWRGMTHLLTESEMADIDMDNIHKSRSLPLRPSTSSKLPNA